MASYAATLARARKIAAQQQTDEQLMAVFCAEDLQFVLGALSPKLVWEGAQATGMTTEGLIVLAASDPRAVEELMWIGAV